MEYATPWEPNILIVGIVFAILAAIIIWIV